MIYTNPIIQLHQINCYIVMGPRFCMRVIKCKPVRSYQHHYNCIKTEILLSIITYIKEYTILCDNHENSKSTGSRAVIFSGHPRNKISLCNKIPLRSF